MKTTLNKIKAAGACEDRYAHLLKALGKIQGDDEPLPIAKIIETNGIEDAVWALRTVEGHDREIRLFACDCAEIVLHIYEKAYPGDSRPRRAIEVSRMYAEEKTTLKELDAARDEAWFASWAGARAAAGDAAWTAARGAVWDNTGSAAWDEAGDAACSATWGEIEILLRKYL